MTPTAPRQKQKKKLTVRKCQWGPWGLRSLAFLTEENPYEVPSGVELAQDNEDGGGILIELTQSQELLEELRNAHIVEKIFHEVMKLPASEVRFLFQKAKTSGERSISRLWIGNSRKILKKAKSFLKRIGFCFFDSCEGPFAGSLPRAWRTSGRTDPRCRLPAQTRRKQPRRKVWRGARVYLLFLTQNETCPENGCLMEM